MFQDGAGLLRLQVNMKGDSKAYLWRMNNRDKVIDVVELSDEIDTKDLDKVRRIIRNNNKNKSTRRFRSGEDNR